MINPLEGNFFDGKRRQNDNQTSKATMDDLFGGYGGNSNSPYLGTGPGTINFDQQQQQSSSPPSTSSAGHGQQQQQQHQKPQQQHHHHQGPPPTSSTTQVNGYNNKSAINNTPPRGQNNERQGFNRGDFDRQRDSPRDFGTDRQDRNRRVHFDGGRDPRETKVADFGDRYSANRTKDRERRERMKQQQMGGEGGGYNNSGGDRHNRQPFGGRGGGGDGPGNNSLPPRFKKMALNHHHHQQQQQQQQHSSPPQPQQQQQQHSPPTNPMQQVNKDADPTPAASVSLRPQTTNNMLFKPKTPSMLPKSAILKAPDGTSPLGENSLLGPPLPSHHQGPSGGKVVMMQQAEPAIIIKQSSLDKGRGKEKNKANKGPTREEVFQRTGAVLKRLQETKSTNEAAEAWKEDNWLPSKMTQTAVSHLYKLILANNEGADEGERELALQLVLQLIKDGAINSTHCQEALGKAIGDRDEAKTEALAEVAAWSISEGDLMILKDFGDVIAHTSVSGNSHPLFLQTLQRLLKSSGKAKLKGMFDDSEIKIADYLPEEHRSDEKLASLLEDHQLSFLMPLLSIQQDMSKQLDAEPDNPAGFAKWIKENVDQEYHSQPGFVMGLFNVVVGHIVESSGEQVDAEKEKLENFKPVLQSYVRDTPELQLTAVYALQVSK